MAFDLHKVRGRVRLARNPRAHYTLSEPCTTVPMTLW
jgi:hypothetical protein